MNQHDIFVQTWENPNKIFEMINEVYGEEVMSKTCVLNGVNCFPKEGMKQSLSASLDI
jgi:hypothetical protein